MSVASNLFKGLLKSGVPQKTPNPTKYKRAYYRLPEGHRWNFRTSYPRNEPCWCESGKKAKRCCLATVARSVKKAKS